MQKQNTLGRRVECWCIAALADDTRFLGSGVHFFLSLRFLGINVEKSHKTLWYVVYICRIVSWETFVLCHILQLKQISVQIWSDIVIFYNVSMLKSILWRSLSLWIHYSLMKPQVQFQTTTGQDFRYFIIERRLRSFQVHLAVLLTTTIAPNSSSSLISLLKVVTSLHQFQWFLGCCTNDTVQ